jgi:hypothetical protein
VPETVVAVPAAQPQLAFSPVAAAVPQHDSFAAGSQHDACTDEAQQEETSDISTTSNASKKVDVRDRSGSERCQQVFSICWLM